MVSGTSAASPRPVFRAFLPALPRLLEILPALGARALPQPHSAQPAPRRVSGCEIATETGLAIRRLRPEALVFRCLLNVATPIYTPLNDSFTIVHALFHQLSPNW